MRENSAIHQVWTVISWPREWARGVKLFSCKYILVLFSKYAIIWVVLLVNSNIKICKYCTKNNSRSGSRHCIIRQEDYKIANTGFILRYFDARPIYGQYLISFIIRLLCLPRILSMHAIFWKYGLLIGKTIRSFSWERVVKR